MTQTHENLQMLEPRQFSRQRTFLKLSFGSLLSISLAFWLSPPLPLMMVATIWKMSNQQRGRRRIGVCVWIRSLLLRYLKIDLAGSPVCSSSKHLSSKARHCLRLRKIGINIHLWCVWQNCGGVFLIWRLSPHDGSIKLTDFQCQHCWNKVLISPNEMCILNLCKLLKKFYFSLRDGATQAKCRSYYSMVSCWMTV